MMAPSYTFKSDKPLVNPPQASSDTCVSYKCLKWFKVNEPIPVNAVYIKSEIRDVINKDEKGWEYFSTDEYFLYEVFL